MWNNFRILRIRDTIDFTFTTIHNLFSTFRRKPRWLLAKSFQMEPLPKMVEWGKEMRWEILASKESYHLWDSDRWDRWSPSGGSFTLRGSLSIGCGCSQQTRQNGGQKAKTLCRYDKTHVRASWTVLHEKVRTVCNLQWITRYIKI